MQYLRNNLKNVATEIIGKIKLDAEDYQVTWDQLLSCYDNSR